MRSLNLVFLSSVLLLVSCTKFGKNVTVKGRVVNPITGEGIPDIRVFMYKATNTSLPADYKTVKEVNTGSDGSFELNKLGLSKYYVKCDVPGDYYMIGWEEKDGISLFDKFTLSVKKGKTMNADFHVVPYSNLILDIQNVNCGGSGDTMYFRKKWLGYTDFEGSYSTARTGCYSYTSPAAFQIPMGTYVYETKVIRSGITTYVYDTVVVPETGIATIDIDY
jgi:hypothetical protein